MPASLDSTSRLAQFEGVLVDHALGDAVAVVARLDAVDLVAQLVGELRDIGEAAQAAVVDVLGNRQGVLGALRLARSVSTVPFSAYCLMSLVMVGIQLPRNTSRSLLARER